MCGQHIPGATVPAAPGLFLQDFMAPLPFGHGPPCSKLTLCSEFEALPSSRSHILVNSAQIYGSSIFQLVATGKTVHTDVHKSAILTK